MVAGTKPKRLDAVGEYLLSFQLLSSPSCDKNALRRVKGNDRRGNLQRRVNRRPVNNFLSVPLLPMMDAANEIEWLPAARRGERWALEQFYGCYQSSVYTLCHRLLGRADDAEDAMQSTFVRAFTALPRFRGDSTARTWLYRIAVNEAVTLLRRRSSSPTIIGKETALSDGTGGVAGRLVVESALARVKPDHRTILVLRYWEELTYEDIAAVLGVSLPAVKMRLKRAKEEFRTCYDDHE